MDSSFRGTLYGRDTITRPCSQRRRCPRSTSSDDFRAAHVPPARSPRRSRASTPRCQWVDPVLVSDVEFRQWTADRRLQHPSWSGFRWDLSPQDVRRPDIGPT
ncbi:hypothetical protein [Saccharothrix yanglingensis]|uniref:ATP dependent DNA ligase n=1 Tax=Saccharothrix yanglingensis TaxID=659496 RepID=UPI0027D276E7|nr:hypothetical protein [Saccharothrix yanglingensis]